MTRLLVDCGHTLRGPHYTGIQRWVRRTLREAVALHGARNVGGLAADRVHGWSPVPELPAHPMEGLPAVALAAQDGVRFGAQDHVLLADRFWHTEAWEALDALCASPARITAVVYDLLSLRQPQWFPPGVGERFGRYLRQVLPRAQRIVCLTDSVARDLAAWNAEAGLSCAPARVVAPGHQVWNGEPRRPSGLPDAWRDGAAPFVLQVGTLEPRKNHALTLAALQRLWDAGAPEGLLLVGQPGWLTEGLQQSLRAAQAQGRVCWLPQCTDAELDWCYRSARAVVYPSAAEGYGLPLAEALATGVRAVASDTPVHREVVRGLPHAAVLCEPQADDLARALRDVLARRDPPVVAPLRSWRTATRELLAA